MLLHRWYGKYLYNNQLTAIQILGKAHLNRKKHKNSKYMKNSGVKLKKHFEELLLLEVS